MSEIEMMNEMFEMQRELNNATYPGWETAGLRWDRAIWLETAELMEGFAWKWWKHQEIDHDNNKVELVDIWHFLMSAMMTSYTKVSIETCVKIMNDCHELPALENLDDVRHTVDAIAYFALSDEYYATFEQVYLIWNRYYGLTLKDLYIAYMTKNVLNQFRQKNGYKDGTYTKVWDGQEDNVHAFEIASSLEINDSFRENLELSLENTYKMLVG